MMITVTEREDRTKTKKDERKTRERQMKEKRTRESQEKAKRKNKRKSKERQKTREGNREKECGPSSRWSDIISSPKSAPLKVRTNNAFATRMSLLSARRSQLCEKMRLNVSC